MKHAVILLALVAVLAQAQDSITATASPSTLRPGQTATITLTLAGTPPIAGVQWLLSAPPGWTVGTTTASSAVTSASKQVTCGAPVCFVWGLNITPVPNGAVATVPVTVPTGTAAGTVQLSVTNTAGATPAGVLQAVTGVPVTVTVLSVYDINGDGQITTADVNLIVAQVASGTCANDVVGNGQCNVLQVIAEVIAWTNAGSKP